MILKPIIRNNIALNAHPSGCKQNILDQINEIKNLENITDKPINVLIIGGSSGYGLASRIALTYKANAYTYNVSFERAAKRKSTASAGYYNNYFFNQIAKAAGYDCDDYNGDAFSYQTKQIVIDHFKKHNKKIDLVIYSLASGIKVDPATQEKYISSLKPINKSFSGYNVDLATETLKLETLEPASSDEIANTIKVMGGDDYLLWAEKLIDAELLNQECIFTTYTYLGSDITHPIYKDGTIGQAKKDLEKANKQINNLLKPLNGKAIISASKAVVTKASIFIPTMALYASALFKVMIKNNTHESIIQHKYRLFKEMIYGNNSIIDQQGFYRIDNYEMLTKTQLEVQELLNKVTPVNFKEVVEFSRFKKQFLKINGFDNQAINYDDDVEIEM
ncbi:MAG: enoyl-ACP reductase FabV [Erysipelotrichaceae bacterium]